MRDFERYVPKQKDIIYLPPEEPFAEGELCAFTGHRPEKLGFTGEADTDCLRLKAEIHEAIKYEMGKGCNSFVTGMAPGVDTWAAEEVLLLKTHFPSLKLYAAVPYKRQFERLYGWQKERYFLILSRCEKVFLISEEYNRRCFHLRNEFMVRNSTRLISVFNGNTGGTANTVRAAAKKGIEIYNISIK